ncbi:hypothetical protein JKP88DRAFT_321182 [Tribonema minus]|uniref:Uncharacterized protein n=1 Tax=Tribonema minus TaxID=303371 RepID=A0A835YU81_9STRA|nr:hypothetical protein JKP88DRAFT_321182 [Tribonema minus]
MSSTSNAAGMAILAMLSQPQQQASPGSSAPNSPQMGPSCSRSNEAWLKQLLLTPPAEAARTSPNTPLGGTPERSPQQRNDRPGSGPSSSSGMSTPPALSRTGSDSSGKRKARKDCRVEPVKTAFAWSKFQSSPDPAELPIPCFDIDDEPLSLPQRHGTVHSSIRSETSPYTLATARGNPAASPPSGLSLMAPAALSCRGAEWSPAQSAVSDLRKVMGLSC